MTLIARLLILIVAALHVGFAVLEIILWTAPTGRDVFGTTEAFAAESADLAFNQGVYNLFLVAGLVWAAVSRRRDLAVFFLGCVVVAGIAGAVSVSPRIMLIQGAPALLALLAVAFKRA